MDRTRRRTRQPAFPETSHSFEEDPRKTVTLAAASARQKHKLPNRTTKTSQKLTFFPEDEAVPLGEASDEDVYDQITKLPLGTIRQDAARLRLERGKLPRVKAYCTSSFYKMQPLLKYLQSRKGLNGTNPKRFDECIYTPIAFKRNADVSHASLNMHDGAGHDVLLDMDYTSAPETAQEHDRLLAEPVFPTSPGPDVMFNGAHSSHAVSEHIQGELFFFDYGVVVCWGLVPEEEEMVLRELTPFEDEKLAVDDVENEEFRFHYDPEHQPRIYNDIISLRHRSNYLVKLTISHAIAQSTKLALFENLVEDTIDATKHIPQEMARTGKVSMSRTAISRKIGELFIMRINVNLVSNVLDKPEIFWSEPALEPLYNAMRGYLEISQRVELLNQRVEVISDLLDMMKEHLNYSHSEQLEWVIIYLITFEALIGIITVLFDVINYQDKWVGGGG